MKISFFDCNSLSILRSSVENLELQMLANPLYEDFILDLSGVLFLDIESQVLLKAWLQDLIIRYPFAKVCGAYGIDHQNISTFYQLGILSILPSLTPIKNKTIEAKKILEIVSFAPSEVMRTVSMEAGAAFKVASMADEYLHNNIVLKNEIMVAVGEALLNIKNWAYKNLRLSEERQQWWLVGSINPTNRQFQIIVYDLGYSIVNQFKRQHMKRSSLLRNSLKISQNSPDSDIIAAALSIGDEQYREILVKSGRRRGLRQMKTLPDSFQSGNFVLRSGSGACIRYSLGAETKALGFEILTKRPLKAHILGTMICWELQF